MSRFILILMLLSGQVFAQQPKQTKNNDTLRHYDLSEVILVGTAQHSPQSIKKAVYDVQVIKKDKIKHLAATSLDDVLKQSLQLQVTPNTQTGKNGFKLFGLDEEYVKILVDGVPLVNDLGYGNRADLSQISLQDVEQVEIVEGAMAVEYGANAVAGVINIITKKSSRKNFNVTASFIEETVGKEFGLFDQGKHIQEMSTQMNLSDRLYLSISGNRQDFRGYFKHRKGKLYHGKEGLRGLHWHPRKQYNTSAMLKYRDRKWEAFYRFSVMNDQIFIYNKSFKENYNPATNTTDPFANDKRQISTRWYHNLNIIRRFTEKMKLRINASMQNQQQDREEYVFYIKSQRETNNVRKAASRMNIITSLGSFDFEALSKKFVGSVGYDVGFNRALMSDLNIADLSKDADDKSLNHYDFYGFSEYSITPNWSVRGGFRSMLSDLFPTQWAYNISSRFAKNNWETRFVFGNAPRNPNFTELYYSFVDINHNFIGNENLKAEKAISLNANIQKTFLFHKEWIHKLKFIYQFIDVEDRISWTIIPPPNPKEREKYTPINIDKFNSWSMSFHYKTKFRQLEATAGTSYIGTSQRVKNRPTDNQTSYHSQMNASLSYDWEKYGLSFHSYYKYNGEEERFQYDSSGTLKLAKQYPYHWLDMSVTKQFWSDHITLIFGVRNLTNTTQVFSTFGKDDTSPPTAREFGYGRSFFGKILFNF